MVQCYCPSTLRNIQIFLILLFSFMPSAKCCMPVKSDDGVIPITTTVPTVVKTTTIPTAITTPHACPDRPNLVHVFLSDNVIQSNFLPEAPVQTPIQSCPSCHNGSVNFYTSEGGPNFAESKHPVAKISGEDCPNTCICAVDGTCYKLTSSNIGAFLLPYCSPDNVCGTYTVLILFGNGDRDTEGLISLSDATTISVNSQLEDFAFKPVTDPSAFVNAATISCDGCVAMHCQTPDD